jgi:hypothetical protein
MRTPVIAGNLKMYKTIDDGGARTAYCLLPTAYCLLLTKDGKHAQTRNRW